MLIWGCSKSPIDIRRKKKKRCVCAAEVARVWSKPASDAPCLPTRSKPFFLNRIEPSTLTQNTHTRSSDRHARMRFATPAARQLLLKVGIAACLATASHSTTAAAAAAAAAAAGSTCDAPGRRPPSATAATAAFLKAPAVAAGPTSLRRGGQRPYLALRPGFSCC